ncbi:DUF6600 domain-containing protein [Rugamonas brunnea]|uniref:DUF6600 domain-containing protein n=1 Tax=Rugamonas brunnea TaxID=2758569 RepID=UPI001C7143DE|nr:DUF6600 domain-containing protein [Rugamonas brunnea]
MKTRSEHRGLPVVLVSIILTFAAGTALADPPARVARLAYVNGAVSLAVAGGNDWVQADINRPLMPGDRVWVDAGGRDEVQIGNAALRMDGGTLVSVLNLDDRTAQFQLTQGRAYLRVRRLNPGDVVEVDTPNLALSIRKPGVYRLEVDPNGASTLVAVRAGEAEAYGEGNAYLIDPGQSYRFGGTNLQDYQYVQAPPDDDFERWAAQRDQRREHAVARRYVSPDMIGYDDLDDQGSWRTVPDYGSVWVPAHVSPDWAPYRDGHWSWIDPWGWTWVDDAPWGFTVSHYGRWTHLDTGWGWVPGPVVERPVYAPALVAFVAGAALALAVDHGPGVAWFPLGPREVYRPAYQASPAYITKVNTSNTVINRTEINKVVNVNNVNTVNNVTNITNVNYINQHIPGAVTAVPAQAFVRAQPVRQAAVPLSRQVLAAAPVTNKVALAPQAQSRAANVPARSAPAPAIVARQVIAHTPPHVSAMRAVAPPHGAPHPAPATAAVVAPQVKVLQPFKAGRPLAPPPPTNSAVATAPQPGQRPAGALPQTARPPEPAGSAQAARPPEMAGHAQAARPPEGGPASQTAHPPEMARPPQAAPPPEIAHAPAIAHPPETARSPETAHPPLAAHPPEMAQIAHPPQAAHPPETARAPAIARPPQAAHPPEMAPPPQIAAQPPRPQPVQHPPEAAHPPAQPPRDLPHQLAQARPVAPPHPQPPARPEPPRPAPAPPREMQHQAPPRQPEPPHAPPPAEAHRPPPEAHRPAPPPAAEQHPAPAKPAEHRPASEKDKRKEEQQ